MIKKTYVAPIVDTISYDVEDIVCTSGVTPVESEYAYFDRGWLTGNEGNN